MDTRLPREERGDIYWILRGAAGIFSPPALILTLSMIGFAGLARDAGLTWQETSFMTAAVWALPGQLILVGAIAAGLSLPAAALAVGLSSIRLMPMVVSLMPELHAPGTRKRTLLFLSHFIAVTFWVFTMQNVRSVPRAKRTAYFGGFAVTLTTLNTLLIAYAFSLMGHLPALVMAALTFLTPIYFLTSLYGSAREPSGRIGLFIGMALVPPAHWLAPEFDILIAGIVGGLAAFFAGRMVQRRRIV